MPIEQHPIPQDVAGYKFRLIGDMTLKQFIWLAGGSFGSLHLPAPLPFFFKYPWPPSPSALAWRRFCPYRRPVHGQMAHYRHQIHLLTHPVRLEKGGRNLPNRHCCDQTSYYSNSGCSSLNSPARQTNCNTSIPSSSTNRTHLLSYPFPSPPLLS